MQKKVTLFITCLLLGVFAYAQDVVPVNGRIKDQQGNPLPGVSVKIKNSNKGTTTAPDGSFSLQAGATDVLEFSYIGYGSQEVPVNNRTSIDITMQDENKQLNEVVVIGYGTQRKKDITGSVSVVGEKEFAARPNTQLGAVLQGKAPGVQVLAPSGKPSAGLNIRIRGTNSIGGSSNPLYVIDGVPTTDTRSLNPADIESVSVLKDASSAAIYGASGANGVVLVTTRKGKTGAPRFDFNAYTGYSTVWKRLDVLNGTQYRELMTEMGNITDWDKYNQNTNWQDEIFRKGISQNYQLAVSGKSEKTTYYLSGGWIQQNGAIRAATMDRFNFKVNLEQQVNNWLTMGTNVAYSRWHDVDVTDNIGVDKGGVLLGALATPPVIGIYNDNGTFTSNPFQDWENPVASTDGTDRSYRQQRVLGNVYADVYILPDLKFRSNFGIDYNNSMFDLFVDPFRTSYGRARQGIGQNNTDLINYWIAENTLSYNKTFGKHTVGIMGGVVAQKTKWESAKIEKIGFSSGGIPTTNAGSVFQVAENTKSEKKNASFLGRVNYSFEDKYLLTANFRADASSVFGPDHRWGYFPSASIGWRVSQEDFLKGVTAINDLKLRAGWGLVGNDQLGDQRYPWLGRVTTGSNYPIGGAVLPGTSPSSFENKNLKWESTEQINVGLDITVLDSRLTFSADAYIKNTSDLLLNVPVPKSTGFDISTQNVGKLRNKGLEFLVSSRNFTGEFQWETDFNISFNRNKVIDIVGQDLFNANVAGRGNVSLAREGEPLGLFYGYVTAGVDPQTGDMQYLDAKGAKTFTPAAEDRVVIGDPNPNFIYGLTNNFSYKNIRLSVFLQGSQGNDMFNASRIETESMVDPRNQSTEVLRRWKTPGQATDIPRATPNNTNNSLISTRYVENGSYMRVKSATLSYDLPATLLNKIRLKSLRVYVTGENLLTFTKYNGFDPEVNFLGTSTNNEEVNTSLGVDFGTYPQTRNLIIGLNVSF
ncbi:TonB-dependent receptor [Chitinophaga agrisoli]|uniref:TonB-dependent receptor n=1 Tax=Chitinophaga agrisoli TaxID=2607653 RepID=A0A5B2VVZ2_9BACT|nr:TonB-dependent receptor [Chitinophaga agrisoli]KAA2242914.1 TonB-dependent receptor [Chitinophaga agrisoli]